MEQAGKKIAGRITISSCLHTIHFPTETQCFSSQIQSFLFPEQGASRHFFSFAPSHIFPELDTDEQKGEKEGEGTITPLKERGVKKDRL